MASRASAALDGIVALLEGTTGATECRVTAGRFRLEQTHVEDLRVAPAARPLPFNIRVGAALLLTGSDELGDLSSDTGMRGAHGVELVVAYGARPHDDYALTKELLDDETTIRAVLEYEPNISLTDGWTGCAIIGSAVEDVRDDDDVLVLRLLTLTLELYHRDERITT